MGQTASVKHSQLVTISDLIKESVWGNEVSLAGEMTNDPVSHALKLFFSLRSTVDSSPS